MELQQLEKSRFLEAIESLSAEVDIRIKKEVRIACSVSILVILLVAILYSFESLTIRKILQVELAEASRVCTERVVLDHQLELIRDVSDESIDAHKKQLMQLVKDIGRWDANTLLRDGLSSQGEAFKGANASNRKVDTAVNEIAKRLEGTYKEQISVRKDSMMRLRRRIVSISLVII